MISKILKYQLHDVIRSKWIIFYFLFFLGISFVFGKFEDNPTKIFVSLMNISLLVTPLVSIIFGTTYFYNSKEYMIFLLSQPIKRKELFVGMFLGLALPLGFASTIGMTLPIIFLISSESIQILFLLNIISFLLSMIFVAISFLISVINDEKAKGLGVSILVWLIFTIIYDGIFLLSLILFNDYPLETFSLVLLSLNPIDVARILILLKTDLSALMGYTGAIFVDLFGNIVGYLISIILLILWAFMPFIFGLKLFKKKDL